MTLKYESGMLTFDLQHQISGGGVADEALRRDTPEVDWVARLCAETHTASWHGHTATGTQTALLQQLEANKKRSWGFFFFLCWHLEE